MNSLVGYQTQNSDVEKSQQCSGFQMLLVSAGEIHVRVPSIIKPHRVHHDPARSVTANYTGATTACGSTESHQGHSCCNHSSKNYGPSPSTCAPNGAAARGQVSCRPRTAPPAPHRTAPNPAATPQAPPGRCCCPQIWTLLNPEMLSCCHAHRPLLRPTLHGVSRCLVLHCCWGYQLVSLPRGLQGPVAGV